MKASPQVRLPGSKIQTLLQGTNSNTAGSLALMALHTARSRCGPEWLPCLPAC